MHANAGCVQENHGQLHLVRRAPNPYSVLTPVDRVSARCPSSLCVLPLRCRLGPVVALVFWKAAWALVSPLVADAALVERLRPRGIGGGGGLGGMGSNTANMTSVIS